MTHDALARLIFIDETMVRIPVRTALEDAEAVKASQDWVREDVGEGRGEECAGFGEGGRVGLQAAVGEVGPFVGWEGGEDLALFRGGEEVG